MSQSRDVHLDISGVEIARDIEHTDRLDELTGLFVLDVDFSSRRLNGKPSRNAGRHQPLFDDRRNKPDSTRAAHRQTATHFDEDDCKITVWAVCRIDDRPGHDVMAAGLHFLR